MQDKLCEIVNHYGLNKQAIVWVEEMSELIKEICKYQRNGKFDGNVYEEITDVQICLDQMKLALKYSAIQQKEIYDYKVDRQIRRIENNE